LDKTQVTIHHTAEAVGGGDFPGMLQGLQNFHMDDNGWCDLGYHFVITMDGRAWEGRQVEQLGAHVAGFNGGNVGIAYAGCFDDDPYCDGKVPREPTEAALRAGARLAKRMADTHGFAITPDTVKGHLDHGSATICPGEYLHGQLEVLRDTALADPGCEAVPASGGILDDGSLCFERRGEPSLWTWTSVGLQDSTSEFLPLSSADPMHVGAWRIEVQTEGWYRIETHLETADPSPSIYRVESADDDSEISLVAEAGWQELGVFFFEVGASYHVTKGVLPSEAGDSLGFDAIRLTPADDPEPTAAGCGCSADSQTTGGSALPAMFLAFCALLPRRRRRSRR
jgi:MYXO-CTERM domain-containing protein